MGTFFRSARALAGQYLDRRGLILVYHSISDATVDPFELRVEPTNFAEHLEVLRRRCTPLRVSDLVTRARERRLPVRSVAITFDDGYADNALVALPLLQRHDMPATMYLISDFIDADAEYWWDAVLSILLSPGELRSDIRFHLDGRDQHFPLGASARLSTAEAARSARWMPWDAVAPTRRHELVRLLGERLPFASVPERDQVVRALREAIVSVEPATVVRRGLTADEVHTLGDSSLIEIGAHSVSHPSLAALTLAAQLHELAASRAHVRALSGQPVYSVAYPFGKAPHVSTDTMRMAQDAGFTSACMNTPGHVTPRADPWQLPRFHVGNWDGDNFAGCLHRWLMDAYGR